MFFRFQDTLANRLPRSSQHHLTTIVIHFYLILLRSSYHVFLGGFSYSLASTPNNKNSECSRKCLCNPLLTNRVGCTRQPRRGERTIFAEIKNLQNTTVHNRQTFFRAQVKRMFHCSCNFVTSKIACVAPLTFFQKSSKSGQVLHITRQEAVSHGDSTCHPYMIEYCNYCTR